MSKVRTLGFHERYNVAKAYIDASPVITPVALLELRSDAGQPQPDRAFDELEAHLDKRIQYALGPIPTPGLSDTRRALAPPKACTNRAQTYVQADFGSESQDFGRAE